MAKNKAEPILELRNVYYSRSKQTFLTNINFVLYPGEVHALVGEHKSGKSSFVHLISGEQSPTRGEIIIRNRSHSRITGNMAIKERIGVVHQEARVIPNLNAVENIIAGTIPHAYISHSYYRRMVSRCRDILKNRLGTDINLQIPAGSLTIQQQQMLEIARIIFLDCDIIILDDIGARMTPQEMSVIMDFLLEARKQNKSIIFIDSDIDNVLEIADRVTTIHHGFLGGTEPASQLDRLKLLKLTYNFALNTESTSRDEGMGFLLKMQGFNEKLISDLPAGVIMLDEESHINIINRVAENILEIEMDRLQNLPLSEMFATEEFSLSEEIMETVQKRETRTWDPVEISANQTIRIRCTPFWDEQQKYRGTIILLEDISMDSTVKDYLARAEKISSIAELAAGVSHEINNPLAIINNYIQILKIKDLDEDTKDKLERMEVQLHRITDITGSLLSFSKQREVSDTRFDLIQLLEEISLLLGYKFSKKNITLTRSKLPDGIMVKGNENRLRQVFVNIFNNAIEAVPEGGRINLSVTAMTRKQENPYAQITIKDNGNGIPPEIQKKIFDPFFSTKVTRENAGLGLSICQHIIENHKGILTFESHPGEYTAFHIQLPLR